MPGSAWERQLALWHGNWHHLFDPGPSGWAGNDNRTAWRSIWPQLSSAAFFAVVMLTVNCFKVYDIVIMSAGGGSGELPASATVLVYYIYSEGIH